MSSSFIYIIISLISHLRLFSGINITCSFLNTTKLPFDSYERTFYFYFKHLDKISDLKFSCHGKEIGRLVAYDIYFIFEGIKKMTFDQSIDFNHLNVDPNLPFYIRLINIKTFNLQVLFVENIKIDFFMDVEVYFSQFDFYIQKESDDICNLSNNKIQRSLLNFRRFYFDNSVQFVKNKFCSAIFQNSSLYILQFPVFINNFLKQRILRFYDYSNMTSVVMNSSIKCLRANFYQIDLKNDFLNKYVFEKTILLRIGGMLESIDKDIFLEFYNFRKIYLNLHVITKVFNKKLDWLNSINHDVKSNDSNATFDKYLSANIQNVVFLGIRMYDYVIVDEDLCLFINFPFNQLVYPLIKNKQCGCTIIWLMKYTSIYEKYFQFQYYYSSLDDFFVDEYVDIVPYFCNITAQNISECNFEKKFQNCYNKNISLETRHYEVDKYFTTEYYFQKGYPYFKYFYITKMIISPLFSVIGIFLT